MTLLQCSIVDERVAVLEANSIFLGFVHATASKTLKVEEMPFSFTTVSKITNMKFQNIFLSLDDLRNQFKNRNGKFQVKFK